MAARFCPSCGTSTVPGAAFCASCGATLAVPTSPQPHVAPAYAAPVAAPGFTQGMALAGLLLNVLIWPGLGSLVAGRAVGWAQGFLMLAGVILALILIGIPVMIAAWIWGLVTGIQLVQESSRP